MYYLISFYGFNSGSFDTFWRPSYPQTTVILYTVFDILFSESLRGSNLHFVGYESRSETIRPPFPSRLTSLR